MISYKPILIATLFLANAAKAQDKIFADSLTRVVASIDGRLGVAVTNGDAGATTLLHGHDHFPMMSVFKFPIALYLLHLVDQHKMTLSGVVNIRRADWHFKSPLLAKYPYDHFAVNLRELLSEMILESDNVACDVLLQNLGGPSIVNDYIHNLGIDEINIACTETQMAADPKKIYANWSSPSAMNTLLQKFYLGQILSTPSSALLIQLMTETTTGPHRLKGWLVGDYVVTHKTGTSNTDSTGLTAATNDVGIITLLSGVHLYITLFLADSHANETAREQTIAHTARIACDHFTLIRIK